MPVYVMGCPSCHAEGEVSHGIRENPDYYCADCDVRLKILPQPFTVLDATPKTVGSIAERNSRQSYWLDAKRQELVEKRQEGLDEMRKNLPDGMSLYRDQVKAERPWYDTGTKGLEKLTPQQKLNYIIKGDSRG